jgi:hypothetical protein
MALIASCFCAVTAGIGAGEMLVYKDGMFALQAAVCSCLAAYNAWNHVKASLELEMFDIIVEKGE